jgi:hypothetical protein
VLDLGSQFDAGQAMTITWQPGTPGSRCGGGTMSFAVSADAGSWTPMGSAAFPSISGQSYPRRTTDVSAPAPFRYVKVWPDACYVDYSSVVLR